MIALDDDQAIMEWRGGSPAQLLGLRDDPAFEVDVHVLDQSWRIPISVHTVAERWVNQLSLRQPKLYRPRMTNHDGNVSGVRVPSEFFRYTSTGRVAIWSTISRTHR